MASLNYSVTPEDIKTFRNTYLYSEAKQLVEEFKASGAEMVEIIYGEDEYKSARSVYNIYRRVLQRIHNTDLISVITRRDRVFLVRNT